ncbi:MAG: HEPN domain-containing protein [Vulcanimicrobiota bacterium]
MTESNRRSNIRLEVERAGRDLESARLLRASGLLEGTMTHAYYAAFHHARALLLMEGIEVRTHRGVIHVLHRDFARTGRLPAEMVGWLSELQAHRESADYDAAAVFNESMADEALAKSRHFIAAAVEILTDEGWL